MFNRSPENINHPLVKSYNKINAEILNLIPETCLFEGDINEYLLWVNLEYYSLYGLDFNSNDDLDAYISWILNKYFDRSSYDTFLLDKYKKNIDEYEDIPELGEYFYYIHYLTFNTKFPESKNDIKFLSFYLWNLRQVLWGVWQRNSEDHLQDLIKEYAELHEIDLTSEKGRSHILSFLEQELSNNS